MMENLTGDNFWLALVIGVIAFMQWRTSEKQRKQDLFDKRFTFYRNLKSLYFSLHNKGLYATLEEPDLFPAYPEAEWLFGKDFVDVIDKSLRGAELDEINFVHDKLPYEIEKAFSQYMQIDNQYNFWSYLYLILRKVWLFFIPISTIIKWWKSKRNIK